jgi:hypothetical protein
VFGVKFRLFMNTREEQFGFFLLPRLERIDLRLLHIRPMKTGSGAVGV